MSDNRVQPCSTVVGPIGVFDSGYGGLTILDAIRRQLPQYDYLYLGDNARAPYGPRSYSVVYEFTRQAVAQLFQMGCHLVILACNTASAKALRTIQQQDLPRWAGGTTAFPGAGGTTALPQRRVLGIIRPTAEVIGQLTKSRHVGVMATEGTIKSQSYEMEIEKLHPDIHVTGVACPFWVPLVEYDEATSLGADYFVKKYIDQMMEADPLIDAAILGCTHYPLLLTKIRHYMPPQVQVIAQGSYVAQSLADYLQRHPEIAQHCSKGGHTRYFTSENPERFAEQAQRFLNEPVTATHIDLVEPLK